MSRSDIWSVRGAQVTGLEWVDVEAKGPRDAAERWAEQIAASHACVDWGAGVDVLVAGDGEVTRWRVSSEVVVSYRARPR